MARLPTLSIAARWVLTIGILAVLLVTGYLYHGRLKEEQANHLSNIAQLNLTIETFRAIDLDELEAEIAELESRNQSTERRYASFKAKYLTYVHSIEIQEALYDAARESDVTITNLACAGPQTVEVGSETLHRYVLTIKAEAPVPPQLLNFFLKLSDEFETGIIESIDMSVPRPPDESDEETTCSSTLQLRVLYFPKESA